MPPPRRNQPAFPPQARAPAEGPAPKRRRLDDGGRARSVTPPREADRPHADDSPSPSADGPSPDAAECEAAVAALAAAAACLAPDAPAGGALAGPAARLRALAALAAGLGAASPALLGALGAAAAGWAAWALAPAEPGAAGGGGARGAHETALVLGAACRVHLLMRPDNYVFEQEDGACLARSLRAARAGLLCCWARPAARLCWLEES